MFRRAALMLVLIAASAVAGCGRVDDRRTITIWHQSRPNEREFLAAEIARYESAHPDVRVRPLYKETEELRSGFQASALAGAGPELVYGPSDVLDTFHTMGLIQDLSPWLPEAEREAFKRLPPTPREITAELSRLALVELLPAAVEGKFIEFSLAVRNYGAMAGKPFETESSKLPYAKATADLIELLSELGAPGCAQSSWGPAVMACCESLDRAGSLVDRLESLGLGRHHDMVITKFDTQGGVLRVIE
jgi:hypothetical protein